MSIFVYTDLLMTCDGGDLWQISLKTRKLMLQNFSILLYLLSTETLYVYCVPEFIAFSLEVNYKKFNNTLITILNHLFIFLV